MIMMTMTILSSPLSSSSLCVAFVIVVVVDRVGDKLLLDSFSVTLFAQPDNVECPL